MKNQSVNTFEGGLNYDLNPLATPNNIVTDAVNSSYITFNGDELSMQNEAGNAALDTHRQIAPETYVPASESSYSVGEEVSYTSPIYTPEGNHLQYFKNINVNRIQNPNYTRKLNWTLTNVSGVVVTNGINLTFGTSNGTISQRLNLVYNKSYKLIIDIGVGNNVTNHYRIDHYYSGSTTPDVTTGDLDLTSSGIDSFFLTPSSSEYEYTVLTITGVSSSATVDNTSTLQPIEITATPTDLTNTEVWQDVTKVSLTEGFYPLAVKEYGGVLYIISGKKGTNTGTDEIEFGSYPSPQVTQFSESSGLLSLLTSANLNNNIYVVSTNDFNPGHKIKFVTSSPTNISTTNVSHWDSNTSAWVKGIYKVGLYHKLEHSERDLTEEYSRLSSTEYWFTNANEFINSTFFKGKLFSRVQIEPLDYFKLDASTLVNNISNGHNYDWKLDFSYGTTCPLKIYALEVSYNIGINPTETRLFSVADSSLTWTGSSTEYSVQNLTIPIISANTYVGQALNYTVTPKFVIGSATSILTNNTGKTDITDYTKQFTIKEERVIPSIYELIDLKFNKFITDLKTPSKTSYEYNEDIATGTQTCVQLILVDEENWPIEDSSTLTSTTQVGYTGIGFNMLGYSGSLSETLGTYQILDTETVVTITPGSENCKPFGDRIKELTLQTSGGVDVFTLNLNYNIQTIDKSVIYSKDGVNNIFETLSSNLTLYDKQKSLSFSSSNTYSNNDIVYRGLGVYEQYNGSTWSAISNYSDNREFRSPTGDVLLNYYGVMSDYDTITDNDYTSNDYISNNSYPILKNEVINLAIPGYVEKCTHDTAIATSGAIYYGWDSTSNWYTVFLRYPYSKINIEIPTSMECTITGSYVEYVNGTPGTAQTFSKSASFKSFDETIDSTSIINTTLLPTPNTSLYKYYALYLDLVFVNASFSTNEIFANKYYIDDVGTIYKWEFSNIQITFSNIISLTDIYYNLPLDISSYAILDNGLIVPRVCTPYPIA